MILSALGIINNLGNSKKEISENVFLGNREKLIRNDLLNGKYTGNVVADLPKIKSESFNFRTNRLLLHCFYQIENEWIKITSKYDKSRIGIVLGSNNLGLEKFGSYFVKRADPSSEQMRWLECGTICDCLKQISKISGPSYAVSTACSSSAKAFSSARKFIENDICDAMLVGGCDDLCYFTIQGFISLGAYASGKTNPFSKNRDGINIGEGAAVFIMEKNNDGIKLCGIGESSDAYHITSPDPDGKGAMLSMKSALVDANLKANDIDYINLHGTGTIQNDLMETNAINKIFSGTDVLCSSSKALTGHLLGAAGAVELGLCWLMLSDFNQNNLVIPHIYDGVPMENSLNLVKKNFSKKTRYCLSNSFAFGGSNASLILGKS